MSESKFLKAHCAKMNRYYGLEIKKFGSSWKVVNMIDLSQSEAKLASSEIEQPSFETNATLIPCQSCGSRKVGGCSCSKKRHSCSTSMKYHFDCIYCDEFKIDYTLPDASAVGGRAGEKITLSQGQEVEIRYADNRPLTEITVGIGWDPASGGNNMDVDSAVAIYPSGELVCYWHLDQNDGAIKHHGDNLTGCGDQDDENITVHLNKIPMGQDKLAFILNIYNCYDRGQTLSGVKNLYINLYDPISKKVLIEYKVNSNYGRDTGILIGAATRKNGGWSFKAIGRSFRVGDLTELSEKSKSLI